MGRLEAQVHGESLGNLLQFHISHVGNQKLIDSLDVFRLEGMRGSRAAFSILSLVKPIPVSEDDLRLIRKSDVEPKTLWDQVGWAFSNPQTLDQKQKGALISLQYFVLESLANQSQIRKVRGESRDLSSKAKKKIQETFKEYDEYLNKVLNIREENDATHHKLTNPKINLARFAGTIIPAFLFALGFSGPKPVLANTLDKQTNIQTVSASINFTPSLSKHKVNNNQTERISNTSTFPDNSAYPIGPYVGEGKLFFQVAHVQWDFDEKTKLWHIYSTVKPGELGYWYGDGNCRTCGNIAGYFQMLAPPGTLIYQKYPPGVVIDGQTGYTIPAPPETILYYPIHGYDHSNSKINH